MGLREILEDPKGGQTLSLFVGLMLSFVVLATMVWIASRDWIAGGQWWPLLAVRDAFFVFMACKLIFRIGTLLRKRHGAR